MRRVSAAKRPRGTPPRRRAAGVDRDCDAGHRRLLGGPVSRIAPYGRL